jgi:hypothetical protein
LKLRDSMKRHPLEIQSGQPAAGCWYFGGMGAGPQPGGLFDWEFLI